MERAKMIHGLPCILLVWLLATACNRLEETEADTHHETGNYELITLSTVANQGSSEEEDDPASRTVYTEKTGGMTVTWNTTKPENEVLQVVSFPTGKVEAPITNRIYGLPGTLSNGNKTLKFSGGDIIRSADNKYHYLYPQPAASQVTKSGNNVVVNYDFSQQTAQVGSTAHLAAGDVMYSSTRVGETQSFTFSRACALLRFVVKLPAGTPAIERLSVNTSSAVFYTGLQLTYATDGSVSVKGTNVSNYVPINITGDQTSTSQRTLTAYLLIPAKDASGNNVAIGNQQIRLVARSGSTYYDATLNTTTSGQKLEPGKRFTFAPNAEFKKVGVNLSENGTANSYIVNKAGGFYSFDATKRGNGVEPTGSDYASSKPSGFSGTIPSGNYTAKILWSMGGSSSASINGVISDLVYGNGVITFNATDTPNNGNAVIALMSGSTIVWSWHIWKVDYDPYSSTSANAPKYGTHTYPINGYYPNQSVIMMKYHLGTVKTQESFTGNMFDYGLLYQWGRKDPFLGSVGTNDTNPVGGTHYKSSGTPEFNYSAGTNGTIALSIANPMSFYTMSASPPGDWNTIFVYDLWGNFGPPQSDEPINKLYGTKTCFDPCPPGYKVAPNGTWTRYFATQEVTSPNSTSTPNVSGGFNKGYLFKYDNVNTTFYVASGSRGPTGGLVGAGTYGYMWSSSAQDAHYFVNNMNFSSGSVYPLNRNPKASAYPVRCAKEN
ncbi:MAG: hypothetical protein LBM06_04105 [Prevotellaceae bacterium]|jgi:hypothetical protein|nr:hypothetical protein [Prevotellaceae bacterium]